jgi:hypothetical protein
MRKYTVMKTNRVNKIQIAAHTEILIPHVDTPKVQK